MPADVEIGNFASSISNLLPAPSPHTVIRKRSPGSPRGKWRRNGSLPTQLPDRTWSPLSGLRLRQRGMVVELRREHRDLEFETVSRRQWA